MLRDSLLHVVVGPVTLYIWNKKKKTFPRKNVDCKNNKKGKPVVVLPTQELNSYLGKDAIKSMRQLRNLPGLQSWKNAETFGAVQYLSTQDTRDCNSSPRVTTTRKCKYCCQIFQANISSLGIEILTKSVDSLRDYHIKSTTKPLTSVPKLDFFYTGFVVWFSLVRFLLVFSMWSARVKDQLNMTRSFRIFTTTLNHSRTTRQQKTSENEDVCSR